MFYVIRRSKRTLGQLFKNKRALICSVRGSAGLLRDRLSAVTQPAAVFSSGAAVSHFIQQSGKKISPDGTSPENSHQSMNSHVALWHLLLRKPGIPRRSYSVTFDLSKPQNSDGIQRSDTGAQPYLTSERDQPVSARNEDWGLPKQTNTPCSSERPAHACNPEACEDSYSSITNTALCSSVR